MKLILSPLYLLAALSAMPAHALFKCVDEKGVTHYGDTMPPQCAKKAVTEMSGQGSLVKQYEAPLTPEQLKAQRDDADRRKDENKRIADQKLRDVALISTYGSEREFDVARDKDLAVLEVRKKTLTTRSADVYKQVAKHSNEMEFYTAGKSKNAKSKDPPPQLVQDLARVVSDRTSVDADLAKVESDKTAVAARYEGEKARWKKLKGGMPAGTLLDEKGEVVVTPGLPSQIVGQSTIIPGRPKGTATCQGKAYECSLGVMYLCRGPDVGGPGLNVLAVKCTETR